MEPRFNSDLSKDENSKNQKARGDNDNDVVEVEESEAIEATPSDKPASVPEKVFADTSNLSSACLICGKIVLNKYMKIHNKIHGIEGDNFTEDHVNLEESIIEVEKKDGQSTLDTTVDLAAQKEKTVQCKFCSKLMLKQSMHRHLRRVHKNSVNKNNEFDIVKEGSFSQIKEKLTTKYLVKKCKICFKLVSSKSSLTRHMRIVHKDLENYEKNIGKEKEEFKVEEKAKDMFQRVEEK